jgi:hypothetical protein
LPIFVNYSIGKRRTGARAKGTRKVKTVPQ